MLKGNLFVFRHLEKMIQSQKDLLLVRHHQYLLVLSSSPVSQVSSPYASPSKFALAQMTPPQWRMEEGSQSWGGSQPWWWGTDWRGCVTTKLEAKHVVFSPTAKPPSPFISGVLVSYVGMSRPESIGFHSSALSPINHLQVFILPLQGNAGTRKKEWDRGGREDQQDMALRDILASHHPWPPIPAGSGDLCGWVGAFHSNCIQPIPAARSLWPQPHISFPKNHRGFSDVKFCLADVFLESCPTQHQPETQLGTISTVPNFSCAYEPSAWICSLTGVIIYFIIFFF